MLKIVSGKYRSREIAVPPSVTVPTKSIVRTGIGNALSEFVLGAKVLDLFAGSGALGIECLSRGASHCDFVDSSKEAVETIRGNLQKLKETRFSLFASPFDSFLNEQSGGGYDIVLLDPPYKDKGYYVEAIHLLIKKGLLRSESALVLEYEGEAPEIGESLFYKVKEYRYGRTKVRICWRKDA